MHIHIDPLGGLAGDMFVAAMSDAFSELIPEAMDLIAATGWPADLKIRFFDYSDRVLSGMRFTCDGPEHGHGLYREMDHDLAVLSADARIIAKARDILLILGQAEAKIHGLRLDDVHFHEIAGWDTLVDVLLSAFFIVRSGATSWSVSPLPRGHGFIRTAHGRLPVPAPATLEILKGFEFVDDGVAGERVTPTGAAILKALTPAIRSRQGRLTKVGQGFGERTLAEISNIVRVSILEASGSHNLEREQISILSFEVDDQTPEDLAVGLDRLRALDTVLDVSSGTVIGKKGRWAMRVQVLTRPDSVEFVAAECIRETTTLGVRHQSADRFLLNRRMEVATVDGTLQRVKISDMPVGGVRVKSDIDGRRDAGPYAEREAVRVAAEALFRDEDC